MTIRTFFGLVRTLIVFLIMSLMFGCSSIDVVSYDSTPRSPVAVDQVEVLLEKPERPHKVIARIQFGPDALIDDYQGQTNKVVKLAAELGANAVIVSYDSEVVGYTGGNTTTGVYGGTSESKFTVGLVIVYDSVSD